MLAAGCGIFGSKKGGSSYGRGGQVEFEAAYRMILEGQYKEATTALAALAETKAARNTRRPDAMFWLAYAYAEQGVTLEAGLWYRRYLEKYPDHRYAPAARDRLKELEQAAFGPRE